MGQLEARNPIDFATLAVSNTAVDLTSATPSITAGPTVRRAFITCETDQVRWRADGTAPTSTVGHLLSTGEALQFIDANYKVFLREIQFIRVTTDATLAITYFD